MVRYTRAGRLVTAEFSHDEIAAIWAFLDEMARRTQKNIDTAQIILRTKGDIGGQQKLIAHHKAAQAFIAMAQSSLEQLPNFKGTEDGDTK